MKARPKRLVRAHQPRPQWDAVHPGPIAQQIVPTHADNRGTRYQFYKTSPGRLEAWIRLPTKSQKENECVRCGGTKHKDTSALCSETRDEIRRARMSRAVTLYALPGSPEMDGQWMRVYYYVPPRMRSGKAILTKV
jgi:hypothetical protein